MQTFKLGVGAGHHRSMHSPVRLHSIRLVGLPVGGSALKGNALVLCPRAMLWHMGLNLMSRVLVLKHEQNYIRCCFVRKGCNCT